MTELEGAAALQLAVLPASPSAAAPNWVTPHRKLLPDSFGPRELGMSGPFLLGAGAPLHSVVLAPGCVEEGWRGLAAAAALAARRSYVPYTRSPAGVALEVLDACALRTYGGCPLESVAFNPTLPPLQYALVGMHMGVGPGGGGGGGAPFSRIRRAVIVEAPGARVSYAAQTRSALAAIAPGAEVRVVVAAAK